jgi:hypothetical protein
MRVRISFDALRLCALVGAGAISGYLWRAAFESASPEVPLLASKPRPVQLAPAPPVIRIPPARATPNTRAVTRRPHALVRHRSPARSVPQAAAGLGSTHVTQQPPQTPHSTPNQPSGPATQPSGAPTPPPKPTPTPAPPTPGPAPVNTASPATSTPPTQPAAPPQSAAATPTVTTTTPAPSSDSPSDSDTRPGWGNGDKNHDHTGPGKKDP